MEVANNQRHCSVMVILLLLLLMFAAFQTNGQDVESYCSNLVNISSMPMVECDDLCMSCFGPSPDECYECEDIMGAGGTGVVVNLQDICGDTNVANQIANITVVNCSAGVSAASTQMTTATTSDPTQLIIIAAAAGGGGALVLCCLLVTVCCCCYCCMKKRRKRKSFDLHSNPELEEHGVETPIVGRDMTSYSMENRNLDEDVNSEENEFNMQKNLALSDNSTKVPPEHATSPASLATPSDQFVRKSASSYEIKGSSGAHPDPSTTITLPPSLPQDKGYIKMSSTGPIQRYRSLQDLVSAEDEDDIYVEPDKHSGNVLVLPATLSAPPSTPPPVLRSTTPSPVPNVKKHAKPATLPKPKALQVTHTHSSQAEVTSAPVPVQGKPHPPAAMPTEEEEELDMEDDYVLPEVFREDRDKQKAENYYNKDAVIVQPKAPPTASGSDTEAQTIYANVDPFTGGDTSSDNDSEDNKSYESIKNYLTDDPEGGAEGDRDSSHYYNLPDVGGGNVGSLEEDNMYVYMKSGQNILKDTLNPPPAKTAKERQRLESEPLGKSKKYINFSREQELLSSQQLEGAVRSDSHQNGLHSIDQSEEAPLYANYDGAEEEEEEELYTEVT